MATRCFIGYEKDRESYHRILGTREGILEAVNVGSPTV